jgi:hypothetical protein
MKRSDYGAARRSSVPLEHITFQHGYRGAPVTHIFTCPHLTFVTPLGVLGKRIDVESKTGSLISPRYAEGRNVL